jgi:hypothetical protein
VRGGIRYVADNGDADHAPNEFGYSAEQLAASVTPWGGPERANPDSIDLLADFGHGALDVLGLVPVFGEVADGANALWYGAEGDVLNTGLSAAGMIPFAGWAATGGKILGKGGKLVEGADEAASAKKIVGATKTDRVAEHLTRKDLEAALRESKGEVVARKPDGTPYDHVKEVREAQRGLVNRIEYLKRQMGDSRISAETRSAYEAELSQASRLLDYSEKYLPRN